MIMNERKLKILEAIVLDYIATAEPISSRTVSKKFNIGLSSATIRNEMSDLEEMQLIKQPHVSAGRIPSDKGYRLYVDNLMSRKVLNGEELNFLYEIIGKNIENLDLLMQETAKAISLITNYTTFASEPVIKKMVVRHLQLVPFDTNHLAMVLVTDSKVIRNFQIKVDFDADISTLSNMSLILNHFLEGKSIDNIDIKTIKTKLKSMDTEGNYLLRIFDEIIVNIMSETEIEVFTSGVRNILRFPEFSDLDKAETIFQTLEQKDILVTLLGKNNDENVSIIIGDENSFEQMKDCSIIRAGYQIGDRLQGAIGLLGPTRMDYSQVVSVLYEIENAIGKVIYSLRSGP